MLWILALVVVLGAFVWWMRGGSSHTSRVDPLINGESGPDPEYDLHVGRELDLHGVAPSEVPELIDAFLEVACARGDREIKIVHGKGRGVLRRRVRALLERDARVLAWRDAASPGSGWGATIVQLRGGADDVAPQPRSD